MPGWVCDELSAAGFDLFATATNHALDYSISGLVHTIEAQDLPARSRNVPFGSGAVRGFASA